MHRSAPRQDAAAEARVSQLVARHERSLMRVALHWSLCRDDALDAYQRALEIYVRRLDSLDPATELAWLKVVVKHEALAVRRQRLDAVPVEDADLDGHAPDPGRSVDDLLAARERVDRSAEALRRLKPDEARALMLKAQGLSYREIGESLGWTYTKVNRCITEGRARFLKVFAEIEAGAECERFAPTLAALAGGTATAEALLDLRPHIRNCAACRATVRELHATRLGRLAALWPLPILVAPLRWLTGRRGTGADLDPATQTSPDITPVADPSPIPDVDTVVREAFVADPSPIPDVDTVVREAFVAHGDAVASTERFAELKALAYHWWHRLGGGDIATGAQLAAGTGGGRVATLGAIIGFCLSGLGAGTVCVVTGVVDNPFAPTPQRERADRRPDPPPRRSEPQRRRPRAVTPIATATPSPVAERRTQRRSTPERERRQRQTARRAATPSSHEQPDPAPAPAGATQDFAFEQSAPTAPPTPAPAPPTGGGEFAP